MPSALVLLAASHSGAQLWILNNLTNAQSNDCSRRIAGNTRLSRQAVWPKEWHACIHYPIMSFD